METKQVLPKVRIEFGGGKSATFTPGGRKRYKIRDGCVMMNAQIKLADGTVVEGVVEIDESSSGEHWGTGIFTPNGLIFQDAPGGAFLRALGRTSDKVFPYHYRYRAPIAAECHDHHVDPATGWSY